MRDRPHHITGTQAVRASFIQAQAYHTGFMRAPRRPIRPDAFVAVSFPAVVAGVARFPPVAARIPLARLADVFDRSLIIALAHHAQRGRRYFERIVSRRHQLVDHLQLVRIASTP